MGVIISVMTQPTLAQTNYSVLDYWKYYSDAENTLYKLQCNLAFEHLEDRKERIAQLSTKEDWLERQKEVRQMLDDVVGPFPSKTELNPVITGKIERDEYTVEKLYFESMPGYKVTAAFFLPKGKRKKLPTIIQCSGHTDLAFRSEPYQHVIINLVLKGFAVLAFDPIGQGERLQYFDEHRGNSMFRSTHEHSYPGAQLFINGSSVAKYMIWDGIRCVDYLLTRKEVDPTRIGITGRSGGGTQSSYIATMDDRILAVAPECYITSLENLWKSRGPQDAEQNFMHGIFGGFDHPDLLEVRAPQPALMITTTRDIFSIEGSRATYDEAKKAYEAFGQSENMRMVEDDAGHESTRKNREALYAFFQKHLQNPGSDQDLEVELFTKEELHVTPTGQLSTSLGSKFLFDINQDHLAKNLELMARRRENAEGQQKLKSISRELSGYEPVDDFGTLIFSGRTAFEKYFLKKYMIEFAPGMVLPFLVFNPKSEGGTTALYLDNIKDKKSDQAHAIPIALANQGVRVIVPDLPGYGQLGPGYLTGDAYFRGTSYNQWFAGILNKKSMVAIHIEAMEKILFHCKNKYENTKIIGISNGAFNSSLLHAASIAIEFQELVLLDPVSSYTSVVSNSMYEPSYVPFAVAGQLEYYDIQDLIEMFAPGKVTLINPRNHMGEPMTMNAMMDDYDFVFNKYRKLNKENHLSIVSESDKEKVISRLGELLETE